MPPISRRSFVAASTAALAAPAVSPLAAPVASAASVWMEGGLPAGFPAQDPDVVRAVVGRSHTDYDGVRGLVTTRRELAKAAWDWGFGDWESALGAASHMGRRDIAELLVAHGARPNLFTFAMLGQVDVVRAVCTANPGIQRTPGPHGITLLQHARHGGDEARAVVEYLEALGDADLTPPTEPLDEPAAKVYVGTYAPTIAPDTRFTVGHHQRRRGLTFARDDRPFRFLLHHGGHAFSPGGAASVRIEFDVADGAATALAIRDGDIVVTASRTA